MTQVEMKKVLLLTMPFRSLGYPSIGISLLKSILNKEGISCHIKYFNIDFADMIGPEKYEKIFSEQSWKISLGEWLFAQEYFGEKLPPASEYRKYIDQFAGCANLSEVFNIKNIISPFLDRCMNSLDWEAYDVIGFSSMFEQNMASVALAHRIKLLYPTKIIVFGGANCEREMGIELHNRFPFIDYICSGEADYSFPELVKKLSNKQSVDDIPGIIYRKNGKSILTPGDTTVKNLDSLPYPDYKDYFDQLDQFSFPLSICVGVDMETSRGCWWGVKSQCKFCGLNGGLIRFRSKSKDRVINELIYLAEKYIKKYKLPWICMVDNILDMKYFKDLLPELKQMGWTIPIFWETKSNLNKEQVQMLSEVGVICIQPGIESLNTHVLKLMSKGVTAIQNIQLLKYCKQFGVHPEWNILTKFPNETFEDYKQMTDMIYKIVHLPPPEVRASFELDRFSPYFVNPGEYGIIDIRPGGIYRFIYPFEESSLFNLAYHFEFNYRDDVTPPDCEKDLEYAMNYWQECYANNEYLHSVETSPSTLVIEDGRSNARISRIVLESSQKDIYEYCDRIRTLSSVFSYIREKYGNFAVRERDVKDFLDEMVSLNLMVSEDNRYLSIAVPAENGYAHGRQFPY